MAFRPPPSICIAALLLAAALMGSAETYEADEVTPESEGGFLEELMSEGLKSIAPPVVKEQKSVVASIVDLKAYSIAAREILSGMGIKDGKLKSGAMDIVDAYGKNDKKEVIGEYAHTIGEIKAKHPNHAGLAGYMIDHLNTRVLQGHSALEFGQGRLAGWVYFDKATFGLQETPKYFMKLKVRVSKFIATRAALHEGKGGQALKKWIASGKSDVYKQFYSKIVAKYRSLQAQNDLLQEEGAEVAEDASLKAGLKKGVSKDKVVVPMPVAGQLGAEKVRERKKFVMPSNNDMKKEAMEETMKYLKKISGKGGSPSMVIEHIEAMLQGTTVKMTSSNRMFAGSNMTPRIKIVGSLGTIQGHLDALPLRGETLEQHLVSPNKKSIGEISHIVLYADEGVKNNPWLCNKIEVQVGVGNPWIILAPEGKKSMVGISGKGKFAASNGFWLDSSGGAFGPYYGLAFNKKYLLLPVSQKMMFTKTFNQKVPICPTLPGTCMTGPRKALEKACTKEPRCQGFSYTHGTEKDGKGCLKYRCEMATDLGKKFEPGKDNDFWSRQAFNYATVPAPGCDAQCGRAKTTLYGEVICQSIVDKKRVHDEKCSEWHPTIFKPKKPKRDCPATKACVLYKVATPPECPKKVKCGSPSTTQPGKVQCVQYRMGADKKQYIQAANGKKLLDYGQATNGVHHAPKASLVKDSACNFWGLPKPKPKTRFCPGGAASCKINCVVHTQQSNSAGVVYAPDGGPSKTLTGGGINNRYRSYNKLSAFEEAYPNSNGKFRCDMGFGPGKVTCYGIYCGAGPDPLTCITRSITKTGGSGYLVAKLPQGYTMTGGGLVNNHRHWDMMAQFEESRPDGNGWGGDMGFGGGKYTVYVRGCKHVRCKTVASPRGNFVKAACPAGHTVTSCGIKNYYRAWGKLSGFEQANPNGNGCDCDGGFGKGDVQCYARCCEAPPPPPTKAPTKKPTRSPTPPPSNGQIKNDFGICLDASQRNRNGGLVHMWNCNINNLNQQWSYQPNLNGQIKNKHGKCLDASQRNRTGGKVHMWDCNTNNWNQQWDYTLPRNGEIKNKHGKCLDASQRGRTGGLVHMWDCNMHNPNQMWKYTK